MELIVLRAARRMPSARTRLPDWGNPSFDDQRDFNTSRDGMETGTVRARSGAFFVFWIASKSIWRACQAFGGTKTVAANSPVRTQASPVLGKPSQPVKGSFSQRSRSDSLGISSKVFLTPRAMESFCAPI